MSDPPIRPTQAEIDLDALAANLEVVRARAQMPVFAVVKADAYGHGLVAVARALAAREVAGFGVALAEEGLLLRAAGIARPILVLNGMYGSVHREVLEAGLTPVVYDLEDAARFQDAAASSGERARVHLKVDTGMHRLGIAEPLLDRFLDGLDRMPGVMVTGLMTHLSAAESDEEETEHQLARFVAMRARIEARGHRPAFVHVANSAGALLRRCAGTNLARVGVALYGVPPRPDLELGLTPVMRIVTRVARVETLRAGDRVGYHGTFEARSERRIATLPIGYGDGLSRHLSNCGQVLVGGVRCPIVGTISMDLTGVDVTALDAPCARGDEVVILGRQADERLTADDLAAWAGTIPYEILTTIAPRVPRIYRGGA